MTHLFRVGCALVAITLCAGGVSAQRVAAAGDPLDAPTRTDTAKSVPWYAPLASLAVPGAGQALLRRNRALAYMAAEAYAVLEYRSQSIEARRARAEYRTLANDVARRVFDGTRPVGDFEYYETLEKYVESGAFDRIPGGDIDPETDSRTFNGAIWLLARQTYWADPNVPPPVNSEAYAKAVSLYLRRAATDEFRWSWRDAALEHDLYKRSIKRSNDAYRRARTELGLILANHLLSMVDAFATVRLRYPQASTGVSRMQGMQVVVGLPWPRGL
ncbi:MAG TPA: hypothetical protein VE967_08125 [Gemmatimonadaceae bacterium]|nr:hypothetical protein [Gemmatimonadaceae bacterium]